MAETFQSRQDPRPLRVFLADDDREMRRMIAMALRRDGHYVLESQSGAALLLDLGHVFLGPSPDTANSVIISDVRMPDRDGLAILRSMRQYPWCPPFILITAFGDPGLHAEAQRAGAHAVFDKPFDLQVLRATVSRIGHTRGCSPGGAVA